MDDDERTAHKALLECNAVPNTISLLLVLSQLGEHESE